MRLIKMLGLGMLACLAVMVFVGVTSASADVFCTESGHHTNACPAGKTYSGNLLGTSTSKALLLQNGEIEEECDNQLLGSGPTTEDGGSHKWIRILISILILINCSGLCEEGEGLNSSWLLAETLPLDVWITIKIKIRLHGCLFGITCYYEFTNASQLMSVSGDTITASSVPLTRVAPSSAFCPNNNMSFDATWLVTKDEAGGAPIYLAALSS